MIFFFKSFLLLLGDGNINPGPSTVSSDSIPSNTLPSDNCEESNMPFEYTVTKIATNYKSIPNERFSKKRLRCFTFECQ